MVRHGPPGRTYAYGDLAVLDITPEGLTLVVTAPGTTVEDVRTSTSAPVRGDVSAAAR